MKFAKAITVVAGCVVSTVALVLMIGLFTTCSDDEAYYLIMKSAQDTSDAIQQSFYNIVLNESQEEIGEVDTGSTSATTGTGLNLLLINNITTECYVKELLELYKDVSEGTVAKNGASLPVETLLGIHTNEFNSYAGTGIPKFYFPMKNGKIVWGEAACGVTAEEMTLAKFDSGVYSKGHDWQKSSLPEDGPFQITGSTKTNSKRMTERNGATNAGRTKIDVKFLPDAASFVAVRATNALIELGVSKSEITQEQLATLASTIHNRGSFGSQINGLTYASKVSTFVDTERDGYGEMVANNLSIVTNTLSKFFEKYGIETFSKYTDSSHHRILAMYAAIEDGWFINQAFCDKAADKGGVYVEIWNLTHSSDKVKNGSELRGKLAPYVRTLPQAITEVTSVPCSGADTKRIYNTSLDYVDNYWQGYKTEYPEYLFKITAKESEFYKNKLSNGANPPQVIAYDHINLGHNVATFMGQLIYAKCLKFAGVNVDPTDPTTYMNTISQDTPGTWSPKDVSWMASYHVDTSKLTEDRIAVLNVAYNYVQMECPYVYGAEGQWVKSVDHANSIAADPKNHRLNSSMEKYFPSYCFDCSGFVYKVYEDAGFTLNRLLASGIWNSTTVWKTIDKADMLPGDVVASGGHTMIFLSGKITTDFRSATMIEAPETNKLVKISKSRNGSTVGRGRSVYKCKRFSKIDTGARGSATIRTKP